MEIILSGLAVDGSALGFRYLIVTVIMLVAGVLLCVGASYLKNKNETVSAILGFTGFMAIVLMVFSGALSLAGYTNNLNQTYDQTEENITEEIQGIYGREIADGLSVEALSDDLIVDKVKPSYPLNENFVQDGLLGTVMLEVDRNAMTGELVFYPQSGESKGTPVPTLK